MIDAGLLVGADQREANAITAPAAEPCAARSTGRIDDGTEDFLVKHRGFFYIRNVDEDVVDAGGAEQRVALGGDRRGRSGFAEMAPGVFGYVCTAAAYSRPIETTSEGDPSAKTRSCFCSTNRKRIRAAATSTRSLLCSRAWLGITGTNTIDRCSLIHRVFLQITTIRGIVLSGI